MFFIQAIHWRRILNSHVGFTNEFVVCLKDGAEGRAASSQGETISIYEDKKITVDPQAIVQQIERDGLFNRPVGQAEFDQYLTKQVSTFGRNNAYALSEAFFYATAETLSPHDLLGKAGGPLQLPRLCLNILNGGWHAYTNPVLSDFSEFMLVAHSSDITAVLEDHAAIQNVIRERQNRQEKTVISGNPVNCFATRDNREVIDFLLDVVDHLGLTDRYQLMIDASAGDLWDGSGYRLGITDGRVYSSQQFHEYWMDLIRNYRLRFLEDPFREQDNAAWRQLTTGQDACLVIGDNFYSTDAARMARGAAEGLTHAAIVKPNQAGTVTAVREAIETAQDTGLVVITSHRSISTESTFLSLLTCLYRVPYIKIGPLISDYSSVVRLNEMIRLCGDEHGH